MIQYEDFSLKIEPKRGEVYPVIVLRSPAGEGRSSFKLPFDPDEIGDILFDLGRTVRGGVQVPLRDVSPAATRTRPQRIGDQLFNALFSGPVRSLLDRSLGMIHERQRGLRIKLHIDPEDPSLAQLASLPWEFLYRKETRDFLNLSRFTPILRYLDVQRPYIPLPLEPPLRILVVISDPAGYVPLDLDRERAQIEASWARQKGVQVEFMEQATILALQDRLAERPYHVLHYMGHGDFDQRTGQGVLVMEDEEGRGAMVDGSTLGVLLRDLPTMRLVFLNACETARVTKEKGLDPFAGVAAAMVMAGIPAVVAMQSPISDSAAITFSQKFYPLLARGDPVDAAVAEGRRAIRLAEPRTMEWGIPVLFMRAPQGVIFRVSEAQREKVPLPQIPELPDEVDEALEQRLAELYTRGLSAFWLEEWEKAARSFQAIVNVRPDYEDAADKLAEAKRHAKLHALYAQAQAAQETEDWSGALAALEELAAEAADFKDTAERLQVVRKQKQLADLYAEAQHLHQAEQWQAVVNVFSQIHAIEPDYADPDELLPTAEREVAEQKRQAKLNNLYSRAVRGMDAGRWQEARQLLAQVQEMESGFRETERLLAKIEAVKKQKQLADLYAKARQLYQAQQWRAVVNVFAEIAAIEPDYADPEGLLLAAEQEVTTLKRQAELNDLHSRAVREMDARRWQEARQLLLQVHEMEPGFRDTERLLARIEAEIEREERERVTGQITGNARVFVPTPTKEKPKPHPYVLEALDLLQKGRITRRQFVYVAALLGCSATAAIALMLTRGSGWTIFGPSTTETSVPPTTETPVPSQVEKPEPTEVLTSGIKRGGTLTYGTRVLRIDHPARYSWIEGDANLTRFAIEYLTYTDENNITHPHLLEKWEASDDLKTWTLHLRKGVTWTTGEPFNADDVVFTMKEWLNPDVGSSILGLMNYLQSTGIEKKDDHTVVLHLDSPQIAVPEHLYHYPGPMLDHRTFEGDWLENPVGTGPFTLEEWSVSERAVLKARKEGYWRNGEDGKPLPYLDEIVCIDLGEEEMARVSAIKGGQIDTFYPEVTGFQTLRDDPNVVISGIATGQTRVLRMRVDMEPWTDVRVRNAVKLCQDKDKILKLAYFGEGITGPDCHVSPVHPEFCPMEPKPYDPEKAKALLAEAGYPNGLDVTITVGSGWADIVSYAETLKQDAEPAGIRISINAIPNSAYWDVWSEADFAVTPWTHRPLGVMVLPLAYICDKEGTPVPWNESRWCDEEFDALLTKAMGTLDVEDRRKIMCDIQRIQVERGSIGIPYWRNTWIAYNPKFKGVKAHPTSYTDMLTEVWYDPEV